MAEGLLTLLVFSAIMAAASATPSRTLTLD